MLFECRMPSPSSNNCPSHCSFEILVQVENESRAKRRSIMNEALIKLVISLLPQETHLLIIESINLCWTQDLHHAHMIGGVFLVVLWCGCKTRVFIHVFEVKKHDIILIELSVWLRSDHLLSCILGEVPAPIIRNWMQGIGLLWGGTFPFFFLRTNEATSKQFYLAWT